ncbi:MAG TPA: metalloregulator ArsR/SmtB family transcription factor [Moraxellaceae bacterium]|nr:metalloregulator ArsR/SmtB family transcription factor [Moraxellaceae bacterium]
METNDALAALSALAQENRLAIFRLLVRHAPAGMAVGQIGETLGLAAATLSFHLKELHRAGLIESQNEGRFIFYRARLDAMDALVNFLTENCCGGTPCRPDRPSRCP